MKHPNLIIKNLQVYGEHETYEQGYVKIVNGVIEEVGHVRNLKEDDSCKVYPFPSGCHCIPGMIDMHIHGAANADTMDATTEALDIMTRKLPEEGTTGFLATTLTQSRDKIAKALANAADYMTSKGQPGQAEILGIHLEGPFISAARAGAQPKDYIIPPDIALFREWQQIAQGRIKLVTLAPEETNGYELVSYLHNQQVIASIGHSDADSAQVDKAIGAGASHITHLFNGMRGMHHREPGTAGAALLRDELTVELIVDGIHVHPEMVRMSFRQKPLDRMVLITDSIRAKCLNEGKFDLGGQRVTVKDGRAYLEDGTLAGSILKMNRAAKNMLEFARCGMRDIVQMTAVNPAKELRIYHRKGSLSAGKDADVVVLNEQHEVILTLCRGEIAYRREENRT